MAHVIEFYIPARFKTKPKAVTQEQRGKVTRSRLTGKSRHREVVCVCDRREEGQRSY